MGLLMCCVCCSFGGYSSKCVDVWLIVLNIISFALSFLSLIIIKWKNVSTLSLIIMILLFLLTTILLLFSIVIHVFRKNGSIKTIKKEQSVRLASAGFALTIILFIVCIVADIALAIDFDEANYPCGRVNDVYTPMYIRRNLIDKNSIDCDSPTYNGQYVEVVTFKEYAISYFCISYTEIAMIFAMLLWRSSKIRIMGEIDGCIQSAQPVIMQPVYGAQYPPYGYGDEMQPQYVFVQGNAQYGQGQYAMQPNMYQGGYNSNQYQQQAQYQQQNVTPVQQGGSDNFNVMMKPGVNVPVGNSQQYSSGRNLK